MSKGMLRKARRARGYTADADVPAAQNFLPDKRDHDGVIDIVVCGVAGRDTFKSKLGGKADHPSSTNMAPAIGALKAVARTDRTE